jgi:hypothetical protein
MKPWKLLLIRRLFYPKLIFKNNTGFPLAKIIVSQAPEHEVFGAGV